MKNELYTNNPKGKILRATKANKLSSEFLLAYILPMIAFDFGDNGNIYYVIDENLFIQLKNYLNTQIHFFYHQN